MSWTTAGSLRYERLIATRGRQVAVAFALLGVVFLTVAAAGVVSPPTEIATETTNATIVSAEQSSAATVREDSELYDRGEVVRDSPVYPADVAPELVVTVETNVSDGRLDDVDQELWLVYRAERDGETYWRESRPLETENDAVSDGSATASATVDVDGIRRRVETLSAATGRQTVIHAEVRHRAQYRTSNHEGELTGTARLDASERTYSLTDGLEDSQTHHEREQVTQPDPERTRSLFGGALTVADWSLLFGPFGVAFLFGAVHAAVRSRRFHDVAALDRRLERARFTEWVSHGTVPGAVDGRIVPIDSLADLVDLAIDADRRVVYDDERELYAVIDDRVAYVYVPETASATVDQLRSQDSGIEREDRRRERSATPFRTEFDDRHSGNYGNTVGEADEGASEGGYGVSENDGPGSPDARKGEGDTDSTECSSDFAWDDFTLDDGDG